MYITKTKVSKPVCIVFNNGDLRSMLRPPGQTGLEAKISALALTNWPWLRAFGLSLA